MRSSAAAQNGLLLLLVTNLAVLSFDEFDGWAELSELLHKGPPEGCDRYRPEHLETVRRYLSNRHWADQALTMLNLIGMVGDAGIQKNRPLIKKCKFATEMCETYFIRPSSGHSSPGIRCPGSLSMRLTDLTFPGAPCCFMVLNGKNTRIYFA
eukprot:7972179-Pyramimonas_sp.AAC.1